MKPPSNHTSLPSTVATFLTTHLMVVLQSSRYFIFHSRDTSIQLSLPWWSYSCQCLNTETSVSQTSFSLYLHNQWTDFHKLSCAGKLQIRAICIYVGCTKATTNNWDIRTSVAIKALSANISWMAKQIHTIKLVLGSAHQSVSNDIWFISKQQVLVEIQVYQCSDIISYLLKLAWQLLWQMTAPIRYEFWSCDGNSLRMDHHSFVYIPLCLRARLQT